MDKTWVIVKFNNHMENIRLIKHAIGAPLFRILGFGPNFIPVRAIKQLKELLDQSSFWAKDRKKKELKQMVAHSTCIVTLWEKNQLIGFGRATSDSIYRAVLWDIVIDRKHQNSGLGRLIVSTLLTTDALQKVERIYLKFLLEN